VVRVPFYVAWPIALAVAVAAAYYLANRAIYYPVKYPSGFWHLQSQVGASDVWLTAHDDVRLHAWWVPRAGSPLVTLFLHGNAGNVTHRVRHIQEITAAGSSVLILDYRGYGRSKGWPTESGLYRDGETGFTHLLGMGYRAKQIILHGESLGTAVAIDLANRRPCAGLVLEAPFTSVSDLAATVLPVLGPMLVRSYNSTPKIRWIRTPKLFLQGDRDEIVPPRLGQQLFAAAQEPKAFWVVSGAGHNDIVETAGLEYRARLREFYERVLGSPALK
jgi:fermentation-respiration switch protein FrsA (DUF1100 family)